MICSAQPRSRTFMSVGATLALIASLAAAASAAAQDRLDVGGFAALRGIATDAQRTWLDKGTGRFSEGRGTGSFETFVAGSLQAALTARLSDRFELHIHGVIQVEPDVAVARTGGVTEAYVAFDAVDRLATRLRVRAGTLLNRTSRENVDPLWASPYTVTLSAVNTWLAEEQRLTGLEAVLDHTTDGGNELELSATGFVGNDTLGTLLGWRGWAMGDRLITLGETLPLPPLTTLAPGGPFGLQQEGTTPLEELDNRIGWAARARWQRPRVALLQLSTLDTRGDRGLYSGQYAWATRIATIGGELWLADRSVVVAELVDGRTGMGPPSGQHVDVDLRAWYVLASSWGRRWRVSARYDDFSTRDQDGVAEPNDDNGHAWTLDVIHRAGKLRVAAEVVDLTVSRPAAPLAGAEAETNDRRYLLELRFGF